MTTLGPGRRRFLETAGAAALVATVAGCVGASSDGAEAPSSVEDRCQSDEPVVELPPPEEDVPVSDPPFPTHGEPIPEVAVPAPLHDREVSTTEFVCERHQLYTFIFARCHEVCPALTSTLRQVQADAIEEGYADEMAFVQITFDPEHDTPEVLAEYEEDYGVDPEPGHWYTLRPESEERAKEVVHEQFGQEYAKVIDEEDSAHDQEEDEDGDGFDVGDLEGVGDRVTGESDDEGDDGGGQMPFMHLSLVLLVNTAGYVERAYAYDLPHPRTVVEDTRSLVEGW